MGIRRYRMTSEGEQPIWASKRELERMGREWARKAVENNAPCLRTGNLAHDAADQAEYERLTAGRTK